MTDLSDTIAERVIAARQDKRPLFVIAGGTKQDLLGRHCDCEPLDISGHRGIIDYQPAELVLTARAGTPLAEIEAALSAERQEMPCESPLFSGRATLGGTLACNLSGPGRPWAGSIRDIVLGVDLVNGKGEKLSFGGQVMKNVAGYDVSRLQAGALGTLGVMTEISIKVLPQPEQSATLVYELDASDALTLMNQRCAEPRPLTGAFWVDGKLYLRLSGAPGAVEQTIGDWGGEKLGETGDLWSKLREMQLPFFAMPDPLWRLSINSTAPIETPSDRTLIDWGGALRWVRGEADFEHLQAIAAAAGGHVCLFRGGDRAGEVRQQLETVQQRLQLRLKQAFDPERVLNPGRLYSWL